MTLYGNLIPFLVIGLFWWKRKELLALPLKMWPPALLIVGLGLVMHIAGYVVQEPRISIVALVYRHLWTDGTGLGTAWLRHKPVSVLSFYFLRATWQPFASRSPFHCGFSFPHWRNG